MQQLGKAMTCGPFLTQTDKIVKKVVFNIG